MAKLLPTTRAQVSGHQFMRRRMEHGLIFGDVRMIHDPLASRRRATIFGTAAMAMIAGVMGLFAWMRPDADPGDAPIVRAADGTLYVRVGQKCRQRPSVYSTRLRRRHWWCLWRPMTCSNVNFNGWCNPFASCDV